MMHLWLQELYVRFDHQSAVNNKFTITHYHLNKETQGSKDVVQAVLASFHYKGKILDFLKFITSYEIEKTSLYILMDDYRSYKHTTENVNVLFRANSVASKAVDNFLKLYGGDYLKNALSPCL